MNIPTLSLLHVAIIMDGNGRWAIRQGLSRLAGHRAGVETLRRIVQAAAESGAVGTLTVYAFSSDNWGRPKTEVQGLMTLLRSYLRREAERCVKDGVRVSVIGRRDRLPPPLPALIEEMEAATAHGTRLHLRLAIDYSSRDELLNAVLRIGKPEAMTRAALSGQIGPDVDLLIRTSGEQRLSDFLLWESAYAEIVFSPRLWPEYGPADLADAIGWFRGRDRRYGRLGAA